MTPFTYPAEPHTRRHGPQGYADYTSFRPWLRDEFCFRCVYCLARERWVRGEGMFHLDHFLPVAHHPERILTYENLLYACATCNAAKSDHPIPDPCRFLLSGDVTIREDGVMEARTRDARRIVRVLGLDDEKTTEFRMLWIGIVALAKEHNAPLHRWLMGFPDDLPDLNGLMPPGGNTQPEGVERSYYARRQCGNLAETY
jgi:hypothetical protein